MPLGISGTRKNWLKVLQKNIYAKFDDQIDLVITLNIKNLKCNRISVVIPRKLCENHDSQSRLKMGFTTCLFFHSRILAFIQSRIFFHIPTFVTLNFSSYICTSNF
jgi:hypothetical protein